MAHLGSVLSQVRKGLDARGFPIGVSHVMTLSMNCGDPQRAVTSGSPLLVLVHGGDDGETVVTIRRRDEL